MAKFDWLKERKRQAQQEKLQSQSQVDYTVQPVSSRFGWNNTGYGPDGINQPNRPAMQLQSGRGPVNLHEGEPYKQLPDGSVRVVSQKDLMRDEQKGIAGGMQQGGIISPRRTPAARQSFQAQPGVPKPIIPNTQPVNITQPKQTAPVNITQPITPQTQGINITGAPQTKDPFHQSPGDLTDVNITQPEKTGLAGRLPLTATDVAPETVIGKIPGTEPEVPTPVTEEAMDKDNFYENMFKKGMGWVEQMMEGGSPAQKAAYQKYIDDLKATQATERMVGAQQAAQGRLGEQTAAARGLMMQRMHGINLAGMEAAGGIEQMQAQERAAEKLSQLGLQGMNFQQSQEQFEFAKDQFDYGKQLDTINALLAEGGEENFKQASMMFQDMYGKDIDFSNSLTQENIDKFNQGWNNLGGLIASGMSWEDAVKVMQQDGTLDLLGLTESDVKSIYEQQQLMNDPLYAQTKMIDNWVDQGIITQDQADVLLAIMNDALTNPEGYNIENGWIVKDAAGNEVGFFTDENEANEFMKDHPDWTSEFMEDHISKTGAGPGGGDGGDQTPKENFEDFQTSHIPQEEMDWFTQDVWEDLDKPETWEEAQEKIKEKYGETWEIYNKYDRDTNLLKSDNSFKYTNDELNKLAEALNKDDPFAREKYGVPKDSAVYDFLNAIKSNPVTGKGITANLTMSGSVDEPIPVTEEDFKPFIGKMVTYKDIKGNDRKVIIQGYEEEPTTSGQVMQKIIVLDVETGKKDYIQVKSLG